VSAPKKPSRGTRSEPAKTELGRRASDSRGVRASDTRPTRKRENATTDVFARQLDSARVQKGDADAAPADKPGADDVSARTTTEDAVPKRATSLESAPIGLRKASISESGGAKSHLRGADFGDVARPLRDTGPVPRSGAIARGTRENDAVTGKHKRKPDAIVGKHMSAKSGPVTIKLVARWRRALRRAGKVSVGAGGAAFACVVVAVGGVGERKMVEYLKSVTHGVVH
jgi:hypothetical protein